MEGSDPSAADAIESRVVWMFGSPRSGSTWLLKMAAEHPRIEVMNEPTIGYHLSPFLSNEPGYDARDLDLDTFTMRRVMRHDPHRFFAVEYSDSWLPGLRRMLNDRFYAHMRSELASTDPDALLFVKEPNGSQSADLLMRAQPEARLLFLLRDGRDVVDSELASFLVGGWQERHFPHMRGVGDHERLRFVIDSAHQWLWRTEVVESAYAEHPGPKHRIRYEALLADPELRLRELFDWLGLPCAPGEAESIAARNAFERLSQTGAQRQNRFARPGAWRENLRSEERDAVESILGAKLAELGYETGLTSDSP